MSQTISFVASDELAEYLENEAERRYTTVSSTAQMLLAEKVREEQDEDSGVETDKPALAGDSATEDDVLDQPPFTTHPQAWYEPDTKDPNEIVAVRIPDDVPGADDRRYYKTYEGAASAIKTWYE